MRTGTHYSYYINGQIEKIENYTTKKRYKYHYRQHGEQKWFYDNGQLRTKLFYKKGKVVKISAREYYPNGNLKSE